MSALNIPKKMIVIFFNHVWMYFKVGVVKINMSVHI